ncbi:MAG: 23S rRNA (adenine(2503)-C(2))-methyltransferase RlmN [Parasporobacterium sp.]|nr:23S rRNA (adenine(2503)-C(2))-methyltransferase RlmN [Parasporobacterium sp.]
MEQKIDIKSLSLQELTKVTQKCKAPDFRARQIFEWLHVHLATGFEEMTNLPNSLKEQMKEFCEIRNASARKVQVSGIDGTRKYLFELNDGNLIESVMMRYRHGNSVCVSSQVGCAMGCRFCASTIGGLVRNLTVSEMLSQVYEIQRDTGERVSNIVIMGMGEPLTNYDNVTGFIRQISNENTLHISQRNITISTCGIVPAIIRLSKESLKCTLALSLHAPNDEIRRSIMPIAEKYTIKEILHACDRYFENTGRRITFEYCLIDGVNDRKEHAVLLADLLKGRNAHVNLIPVNPVRERENGFGAAKEQDISAFRSILEDAGITVTRRREMGRDIQGACGQLVRRSV